MPPATSLARLRKQVLDLVMSGRMRAAEACQALRISRSRFYELRARYLRYGEAGLLPKPRPSTRPDRRLSAPLVDQIIAYAIHHPTEGPRTIAAALALPRFGSWRVSHGGVSNVLARAGLGRVSARLAAAEALSAAEGGPITERALRDLRSLEVAHRHIGSEVPGEQVFCDTMSVGTLKGVGRIWQYSAVDGACSFAFAKVLAGEKSAEAAAHLLEHHVLPAYREAGIELSEVVVDGGPEFMGEFRRTCARLRISRRQLPPRSPDLNAFVERFQGTVLHLHYRTAFRYRFYACAEDIDADLQAFLRFYNFERPHRGYRTKGRRPAEIFYAHAPGLLEMKGWDADEFTPPAYHPSVTRSAGGSQGASRRGAPWCGQVWRAAAAAAFGRYASGRHGWGSPGLGGDYELARGAPRAQVGCPRQPLVRALVPRRVAIREQPGGGGRGREGDGEPYLTLGEEEPPVSDKRLTSLAREGPEPLPDPSAPRGRS